MRLVEFLSGIYMANFAACGVFFLKFYKSSRDRFFMFFCIACFLMSFERVALLVSQASRDSIRSELTEAHSLIYLIRLAAFLMILFAVIEKNRRAHR